MNSIPQIALSAALIATWTCAPAQAQITERVSVTSTGAQANGASVNTAISADGRFVAFDSAASNLVAGDTNAKRDVFVRDLRNGTTECVSLTSAGLFANLDSEMASISADGRFVAFHSRSTNLVPGDTNNSMDVFVHDRQSGTIVRVSVATGLAQANADAQEPAISGDGRYVAFESWASNLVAGDSNGIFDVFVHDRSTGTTEIVTMGLGGAAASSDSYAAAISGDGRFVAFQSAASNLVPGDTNNQADVFVRDRLTGAIERVSIATTGAQANDMSGWASISPDGRYVAYESEADNLDPTPLIWSPNIFVRDRNLGTTAIVHPSSRGNTRPTISADGRFVAFAAYTLGAVDGIYDAFVVDRQDNSIEQISIDGTWNGGNMGTFRPVIATDGRSVAFDSLATNYVVGDTNRRSDAFVRECGPGANSIFCSGDGSATACPCTPGGPNRGCSNSYVWFGASLGGSGRSSLTQDSFQLAGALMPDGSALFLQGTTRIAGGAGVVFGDGLRCVGGAIVRLATKTNVNHTARFPEAGEPPVSQRGLVTTPGVRTYQVWYRNAADFCTPATFNLTNGLEVTWLP